MKCKNATITGIRQRPVAVADSVEHVWPDLAKIAGLLWIRSDLTGLVVRSIQMRPDPGHFG